MTRHKNRVERKALRISISMPVIRSLELLTEEGFHGSTVPECAARLLERKVREMFDAGWVPKAKAAEE